MALAEMITEEKGPLPVVEEPRSGSGLTRRRERRLISWNGER
jgi:hypothetical protein